MHFACLPNISEACRAVVSWAWLHDKKAWNITVLQIGHFLWRLGHPVSQYQQPLTLSDPFYGIRLRYHWCTLLQYYVTNVIFELLFLSQAICLRFHHGKTRYLINGCLKWMKTILLMQPQVLEKMQSFALCFNSKWIEAKLPRM